MSEIWFTLLMLRMLTSDREIKTELRKEVYLLIQNLQIKISRNRTDIANHAVEIPRKFEINPRFFTKDTEALLSSKRTKLKKKQVSFMIGAK